MLDGSKAALAASIKPILCGGAAALALIVANPAFAQCATSTTMITCGDTATMVLDQTTDFTSTTSTSERVVLNATTVTANAVHAFPRGSSVGSRAVSRSTIRP